MKTSYRYLMGVFVGLAAAFLLQANDNAVAISSTVADLAARIGRYFFLPLVFFSLPIAVTQLRRANCLGALLGRSTLYALVASATLSLLGTLVVWSTSFGRIPLVPGGQIDVQPVDLLSLFRELIPYNSFRTILGNPSYLLPLIIPAFILGWHMHYDREVAEPAFNLFDSLSRLLYRANKFLLLLMPGLLAILTLSVVLNSRRIIDFRNYLPLLGILSAISVVLLFGIYPFILWAARGRRSPWRILGASFGVFIGAFVSGSPLFNYGNLVFHLKEKMGIRRRSAALIAPVYVMLARGGTALVAAACMMTVIRSYSSLEITLFQAAWTALFSFLVTFALPAVPEKGLTTSLVMLGILYGRGLNDGWLILVPILPLLGMIAVLLDTATSMMLLLIADYRFEMDEA